MHVAVQAFRYVNIVGYAVLAALALLSWRRRRDPPGRRAAAAFGVLGLAWVLALVPDHPGDLPERAVGRVALALLVLFPFLLLRFTSAFRTAGRDRANALVGLTAVLLVWTLALPSVPQRDESWPPWFAAYVALFLLHWTLLAALTATRLALAAAAQPTLARRRMLMLALGAAAITAAIFLAAVSGRAASPASLASGVLGSVALAAFYLGLSPPTPVRLWWRAPDEGRLRIAMVDLTRFAQTQEEVASRVLQPAAGLVGARALAIRNEEGRIVGAWNVPPEAWSELERLPGRAAPQAHADAEVLDLDVAGGSLVVWTSPYVPFFGEDELALLRTLGSLTGLALDRVRLFQGEHETRLALERANEVKSNFVALAAHELRTPMTTIHGFVTTLHHLADRLDDAQRRKLREALLEQTERMALLIEQLLDLSRLDAEAIEIVPQPLAVRPQLEEIVRTATGDAAAVDIDVPEGLVAQVDRNALERIVSNLVTNALRYGQPPVTVQAEQTDNHFRLTVEDAGAGVPQELVPDLFERFTRSEEPRPDARGTGLGLAIARSYARAHGGDLLYEHATPHGARFRLVLPAQPVSGPEPPPETASP